MPNGDISHCNINKFKLNLNQTPLPYLDLNNIDRNIDVAMSELTNSLYTASKSALIPNVQTNFLNRNINDSNRWQKVLQYDMKKLWYAIGWNGMLDPAVNDSVPNENDMSDHFKSLLYDDCVPESILMNNYIEINNRARVIRRRQWRRRIVKVPTKTTTNTTCNC